MAYGSMAIAKYRTRNILSPREHRRKSHYLENSCHTCRRYTAFDTSLYYGLLVKINKHQLVATVKLMTHDKVGQCLSISFRVLASSTSPTRIRLWTRVSQVGGRRSWSPSSHFVNISRQASSALCL